MKEATFIEVDADVRYWEDATVNGVEDIDGTLVPCRKGDAWAPTIRLADGYIKGWPEGTTASIYYKVCDQGLYWLLSEGGLRIAKWRGDYVPDNILCVGENGYGDYIIFKVNGDGFIENWNQPVLEADEWEQIAVVKAATDAPKPPTILTAALRQYRHNAGDGFVFGYDKEYVDEFIAQLVAALDRLAFAAECRDNTSGDAVRLITVRAELAAAAKNAREALAAYRKGGE
ncbi:MAG: hypothetical protein WC997_02295 [Porticoccaceae bacterium]